MTKEVELNFKQIINIPKINLDDIDCRKVLLPCKTLKKHTLFLDLDETLIHSIDSKFNYESINVNLLKIKKENINVLCCKDSIKMKTIVIKVLIRPFAIELLQELSKLYEIVVINLK